VLRRAGEVSGSFQIETTDFPWSCEYYLAHGEMMPKDGVDQLRETDAIYLGAVGFPRRPGSRLAVGLAAADPQGVRPSTSTSAPCQMSRDPGPTARPWPERCRHPLRRENTEGEYVGMGGRFREGTPDESAVQVSLFTRKGVERVARYAFGSPGAAGRCSRARPSPTRSTTRPSCGTRSSPRWGPREFPDVEVTKLPRGRPLGTVRDRRRTRSTWWSRAICSATSSRDLAAPSRAPWACPRGAN